MQLIVQFPQLFFGSFWDHYTHISQMKFQSSSRFLCDVCLFCSTVISEPANHLHSKTAMSSLENTNSLNERLKNTMSLYTFLLIWWWFLGKSYMDGIVIQGLGSARQRLTKRSRRPLQLLRCGELMGGFEASRASPDILHIHVKDTDAVLAIAPRKPNWAGSSVKKPTWWCNTSSCFLES